MLPEQLDPIKRKLLHDVVQAFQKGRDPRLMVGFEWLSEDEPYIHVILYRENTEELPEEARGQAFAWMLYEAMPRANEIYPVTLDVLDYVPKG